MRNSLLKRIAAALLAAVLILGMSSAALATEPTVPETTAPAETLPETEPAETAAPETEPAATEPEASTYTVDTESAMFKALDTLTPELKSDQLMVYDATNDKMLYTYSNEGDKLYPASVTKLFSAYVALRHLDSEEVITVGDELEMVPAGSSLAFLARGQQLYARTLVEGMMLPSGNDAAIVLACAAGRKIAEDPELEPKKAMQTFVAEMNAVARELGFEKSHFANPDGFHVGCHYTCLNDMARIAKLALENEIISRYIRRHKDEVNFVSGHYAQWKNTNLLLDPEEGFYRRDAIGMKTGFTRQAEYCLLSAFKCRDGRILVVGAFGSDDEYDRLRDIMKLINAAQEQLKAETAANG